MKSKELRSTPVPELQEKLLELRKDLMKQNAQIASGTTPKSPGQIRTAKKTIAKILTELKRKAPRAEGDTKA